MQLVCFEKVCLYRLQCVYIGYILKYLNSLFLQNIFSCLMPPDYFSISQVPKSFWLRMSAINAKNVRMHCLHTFCGSTMQNRQLRHRQHKLISPRAAKTVGSSYQPDFGIHTKYSLTLIFRNVDTITDFQVCLIIAIRILVRLSCQ